MESDCWYFVLTATPAMFICDLHSNNRAYKSTFMGRDSH